ncbi:BON domain-containing protein [Pandoraea sputorum]|uniref:BON domain-containing protein n=1 Tax=Pandoraea sputorum TaxID=93222 RepID=UPI001E58B652|nr:BON domain-containing protein [Pandoraea sputorum]MCE4059432.1 BON domain-containing protein [Pandoraea sputorum]
MAKRNAKASNVEDTEGEAGQAAGSRGRSGRRGEESADVGADGAVHDAIRKSLSGAVDLDVSHVEVTVTSGLVLLTGYVPERWMQHVVQTEVEKVDGVKGVDNQLHERRMKSMSRPGESQEGHKI